MAPEAAPPGPSSPSSGAVTHPRLTGRRARGRASWWARAWTRAVEESAYSERDLTTARAVARGGRVGRLTVDVGGFLAAVEEGDLDDPDVCTVSGSVPVLDEAAADALVETVAAESGRLAALLAGDLPHSLVEHAEEAGVELLPYGGELVTECTCTAWVDPCGHALAVLVQLGWLAETDPFVLLHLRGLPREELLARLHARVRDARGEPDGTDGPAEAPGAEVPTDADGSAADRPDRSDLATDLETALDAAARAARVLEILQHGDPEQPLDHLL